MGLVVCSLASHSTRSSWFGLSGILTKFSHPLVGNKVVHEVRQAIIKIGKWASSLSYASGRQALWMLRPLSAGREELKGIFKI